jgi:hypothetical protein
MIVRIRRRALPLQWPVGGSEQRSHMTEVQLSDSTITDTARAWDPLAVDDGPLWLAAAHQVPASPGPPPVEAS